MTPAQLLNLIANDPAVLPWVAPGAESIDLTGFFTRPGNLMVGDARGAVLFGDMTEGFYSCHWLLTRALRGRQALHAIRGAFGTLFTEREAVAITGLIPRENRASRAMAHALGCRPVGEAHDAQGRSCTSFLWLPEHYK